MVASINSISASAIPLLFGTTATAATSPAGTTQTLLNEPTGNTDDVFKAGNAIGKIIDIIAGMNAADAKTSIGMFTMEGAVRTEGEDGEWSETKTGTGTVVSDAELEQNAVNSARQQAAGTGAQADRARAWLDAKANGKIETYDMSDMGVTSVLTKTNAYNADGSDKGTRGSYNTKGMDQFLAEYVTIKDEVMYDKATGKYAGISQNGTQFTYSVW